jgi:hypothetical protein
MIHDLERLDNPFFDAVLTLSLMTSTSICWTASWEDCWMRVAHSRIIRPLLDHGVVEHFGMIGDRDGLLGCAFDHLAHLTAESIKLCIPAVPLGDQGGRQVAQDEKSSCPSPGRC